MDKTLRLAVVLALLAFTAVFAAKKPTPTPTAEQPTSAPAAEEATPTSQPSNPEGGRRHRPTSLPAEVQAALENSIEIIMMGDEIKDLPPGLVMPKFDAKTEIYEFLKPSKEQQKLWVQYHKKKAEEAIEKSSLKLVTLETDHYLIYTNWPVGDHKFLKDSLEGLFKILAKQFDIDDPAKHFLGKMPVYCVETKSDFQKLSRNAFDYPVRGSVLGYCQSNRWGMVKLVLYRTESYRGKSSLVRWGEVMSHEGTHAFLARYRSNRHVTGWMNEGLAEYMSCLLMAPKPGDRRVASDKSDMMAESIRHAQWMAREYKSSLRDPLFDNPGSPPGDFYPIAWSLTKMLVEQNPKAYVQMIKDVKDGMDPEKALQKNFNCDYDKLEAIWRKWVPRLTPVS